MNKEQAVTLVEYNIWVNHKVLFKAAHLSPEEFLGCGPGRAPGRSGTSSSTSLTTAHTIAARL